jgi:hypothetical protein
MTPDAHLNRPPGSPLALHKRQVDPFDTPVEAVDFGQRHSEVDRFILQFDAAPSRYQESLNDWSESVRACQPTGCGQQQRRILCLTP